jgi:hypothetical protein
VCLLLSLDSLHQSGMIPINTGITYIHFISTLSNLTSMGTALGYIVTQDLYIVWGLARGTLENSLWFSLARCESFFCFSLVILCFGFPLQVSSLWTLIIRLPLHQLSAVQKHYQGSMDHQQTPAPDFKVGEQAFVKAENIHTTCPFKKLSEKSLGPFDIIA